MRRFAFVKAVMAHSVNERTREIGMRLALGATGRAILQLVLGQGMIRAMIGLAIGLCGAIAVTRGLRAAMAEVAQANFAIFVIGSLILVLAAVLGCWVPSRQGQLR